MFLKNALIKGGIFLFFLSWFFCGSAAAQSTVSKLPVQKTQTQAQEGLKDQETLTTQLSFLIQQDSYISKADTLPSSERYFQAGLLFTKKDQHQDSHLNLVFGGYPENKFTYIAAPEIYYQTALAVTPQVGLLPTLGRRIFKDSYIDQEYNLGVVNPFLTQDHLHYQTQGLQGVHVSLQHHLWDLRLSYLALYLPNQGPSVREQDGRIITSNRWSQQPPQQFAFNNQNKEIVYSIKDYKVQDILLNPGAVATLRLGPEQDLPHMVVSYARKPINEIALARETYANLDIVGQVKLSPVVVYSKTLTADARWNLQNFSTSLSYIEDHPENQKAPDDNSIQTLEGLKGIATGISWATDAENLFQWGFGVSAAQFWGGHIQDLNSDGTQNLFTFSKSRLLYREPIQSKINLSLNGKRPLSTSLAWIYDREQKGSLFSVAMTWQPIKESLFVNIGADILGTEEDSVDEGEFLKQYRANDRFTAGLQYVF